MIQRGITINMLIRYDVIDARIGRGHPYHECIDYTNEK